MSALKVVTSSMIALAATLACGANVLAEGVPIFPDTQSHFSSAAVSPPNVNTTTIEVSKSFGIGAMGVAFSQTGELNPQPPRQDMAANAVRLGGALMLSPRLALSGHASYGVGNRLGELMRARGDTYSVALIAADNVKRGDRFSVAVSQPMHSYSTQTLTDMLAGANGASVQMRERLVFSMVPLGGSLRTELNYQSPVGKDATAGVTFLIRRDPNNVVDNSMEKLLVFRYKRQF